jgi:hypothetical protein
MSDTDPCNKHPRQYEFEDGGNYIWNKGTNYSKCMRCGDLDSRFVNWEGKPVHHRNCVDHYWASDMIHELFPSRVSSNLSTHDLYHVANALSNYAIQVDTSESIPEETVKKIIKDSLNYARSSHCEEDNWENLDLDK